MNLANVCVCGMKNELSQCLCVVVPRADIQYHGAVIPKDSTTKSSNINKNVQPWKT